MVSAVVSLYNAARHVPIIQENILGQHSRGEDTTCHTAAGHAHPSLFRRERTQHCEGSGGVG